MLRQARSAAPVQAVATGWCRSDPPGASAQTGAGWPATANAGAATTGSRPPRSVEAARAVLGGIDLDPASCAEANRIVQASAFYSVREDGLKRPWFGRVWLNPPYGNLAPKFVVKFAAEYRSGAVTAACLLLAVHHMATRWFGALDDLGSVMCLPRERLQFSGSTVRPAHGR
jgi:DNA N-6-adenine-methyltransferase (Dam)